ncbi:TraR/DksA family transcriptional regulator [Pseudorhodoplanes sp.]|uniref:TraR/DksA family transcriptional regulator n=1 Tax=Pseudorhodoplanes sp. TaxID=1934341 RepID=UPI003919DC08
MDIEAMRARLIRRRAEIEAEDEQAASARETVVLDQTSVGRLSRMDALQGQQMALAAQRRRQGELVRIDQALQRMERGEYGACVSCGEDIEPKRLEFDPAVPTCLRCASKLQAR